MARYVRGYTARAAMTTGHSYTLIYIVCIHKEGFRIFSYCIESGDARLTVAQCTILRRIFEKKIHYDASHILKCLANYIIKLSIISSLQGVTKNRNKEESRLEKAFYYESKTDQNLKLC